MHFGLRTLACSVGVAACASTDPVGLPNHHDAGATTASGGAAGAAGPGSGGATGSGGVVSGGGGSGGITDGGHEAPSGTADAGRDAGRNDATSIGDNLAPAQGALLGLYYGAGTVAATEATVGRQISIHLVYYAWNDDWAAGTTKSDLLTGRIPLVNWEPDGIDFHDIVS